MNREKLIIILVGFLDILWISMILPTLPDLAKYFDVSEHQISYWITAYALFAFLATPILWQLSDILGRKKVLMACVIWSFLSSIVIVFSPSFIFFIIWRIINWITWWNISILQAIINDISNSKEEKAANLWMLWAMFWTAFIFWPLVWALLLHINVMAPYIFMAFVAFIEIIVLFFLLKETNTNIVKKKIYYNPFKLIIKYFKKERLNLFLASFFLIFLAFSIYQAILSLYLSKEYWVSWSFSWYVYAIFWVIVVLNQAFFLRKFWLKNFSLKTLLYIINIWALIIYILLSLIHPLYFFLAIFLFLIPFQSLLNPVYQSEILEHALVSERWEISWVTSSITAVSMFLWPLIWWLLLDNDINIFLASSVLIFASLLVVIKINKTVG